MAWCENGHFYDEGVHGACPTCTQAGTGPAGPTIPATVYEEQGGGPAGGGGSGPYQSFGATAPAYGAGAPPPPGGGLPPAMGPGTVLEEAGDDELRLMGFLVITASKQDDEYRYFRLRKGVNFIGRFGSRCHVELRDQESSTQHALIVCTNQAARLVDLDSSNGTRINRERMEYKVLEDGDAIAVGRTTLVYVAFPYFAED